MSSVSCFTEYVNRDSGCGYMYLMGKQCAYLKLRIVLKSTTVGSAYLGSRKYIFVPQNVREGVADSRYQYWLQGVFRSS